MEKFVDRMIGSRLGWSVFLLVAAVFTVSQIYILPKVLDVSNGSDFRLIWLAGNLWNSGADPYSIAFDRLYAESFGMQLPSHFWVYPPYWILPAVTFGSMRFEAALLAWNLLSWCAILFSAFCLATAMRPGSPLRMVVLVLALIAAASMIQATPYAISIGQTSSILLAGTAMVVCGYLRRWPVMLCAGLVLAMLKPQAGLLLLAFAATQGWTVRPALVAVGLIAIGTVPAFLVTGLVETLTGFLGNVARYNGSGADANLPEHLVGLQKLLAFGGISVSSTPLVLISAAGIAVAGLARMDGRILLQWSIVLILLMSGLHTYDLALALCLLPFATAGSWRGWVMLAGAVLVFRPPTLALMLPVGALDSDIFLGSFHATIALILFACAALPASGRLFPGRNPDAPSDAAPPS